MCFRDYWVERAKEAFVKARVKADAVIFLAVIIFGLIGLRFSKFPVDKTVWWIGFIVFAGWLIIEVCFISPYRHAQTLIVKCDELQAKLNAFCESVADKRQKARE